MLHERFAFELRISQKNPHRILSINFEYLASIWPHLEHIMFMPVLFMNCIKGVRIVSTRRLGMRDLGFEEDRYVVVVRAGLLVLASRQLVVWRHVMGVMGVMGVRVAGLKEGRYIVVVVVGEFVSGFIQVVVFVMWTDPNASGMVSRSFRPNKSKGGTDS